MYLRIYIYSCINLSAYLCIDRAPYLGKETLAKFLTASQQREYHTIDNLDNATTSEDKIYKSYYK